MSKANNVESDIVYSTPKENREDKKEYKKRNFEKRPDRSSEKVRREDTKPSNEDSDGFEIITEKKQGEKKRPYQKREYNDDGERRKFHKRENGEERPATAVKQVVAAEETKKPVQSTTANKVVVLETVNILIFIFLFINFLLFLVN